MESLRGVVERITYDNEEIGYSVINLFIYGQLLDNLNE